MMKIWDKYSESYDKTVPRTSFYKDLLEKTLRNLGSCEIVLDLGCGTGNLAIELAKKGKEVHAIDYSGGMLQKFKEKLSSLKHSVKNKIHIRAEDLTNLNLHNNAFDGAACINSLYCLKNPKKMLKEVYRVLKPNGLFVVSGPKPDVDFEKIKKRAIADYRAQGIYGKIKKDLDLVEKCNKQILLSETNAYTASELERILLEEIGFKETASLDEEAYLGQSYFVVTRK